jgi:hypothetical protein
MRTTLKTNVMKKIILYCLLICASFAAHAQTPDDGQPNAKREEKIKALYVAYITQQLQLSSEEAQKFWPVHAQYDAELRTVNSGSLSEIEREDAALKVKKKYAASFTKILGADRCNKFNIHDNAFRDKVKARLREMRQQKRLQQQDGGGRIKGRGGKNMNNGF